MSSKTKILLLKKRECIYTLLFAVLGIVLIILLILMFLPATTGRSVSSVSCSPGIYTSQISLQGNVIDIEVRADHSGIHSIGLQTVSEAVSAMYPTIEPSLDKLARQICDSQSLHNIYYEKSSQYTSQMLLGAIRSALELAQSD